MSIEKLYYSEQLKSSLEIMKEKMITPITKEEWLSETAYYSEPEQHGFDTIKQLYDGDYLVLTESYNGLSNATTVYGDGYSSLKIPNPNGSNVEIMKDNSSIQVYINLPDGNKNIVSVRNDNFSAIIDKVDGNRYIYKNEDMDIDLEHCIRRCNCDNKDNLKTIYADLKTGEILESMKKIK